MTIPHKPLGPQDEVMRVQGYLITIRKIDDMDATVEADGVPIGQIRCYPQTKRWIATSQRGVNNNNYSDLGYNLRSKELAVSALLNYYIRFVLKKHGGTYSNDKT